MPAADSRLRKDLVRACRVLDHNRLVHGYGHASARSEDGKTVLITPRKGLGLVRRPQEIQHIALDGGPARRGKGRAAGKLNAPFELYLHTEIYRARPEVKAICRTHGVFALVLSVLRLPLRPVHELGLLLGPETPVFDSAELISTPETGRRMAEALGPAQALLLRGNGALTVGASIEEAVVRAILLETSAEVQWRALAVGEPAWIVGEEYEQLSRRGYEAVGRPWQYYLAKAGVTD